MGKDKVRQDFKPLQIIARADEINGADFYHLLSIL